MKDARVRRSKLLALVLRHEPEVMGLELDAAGWVEVDVLLRAFGERGEILTRAELEELVATSDKKRFALSDDGARIRASQGHSVDVDLGYEPHAPPPILFHGTVEKFLDAIRREGLVKGARHHVHLSATKETAEQVGRRRGKPVVLEVRAGEMQGDGHVFLVSANGVWLTDHVPPRYLLFPT